ncbi:MAG: 4Fe-4S binding protein [Armatimonadetes bacterium]|jgi:Pyruvate/2-oxoacid:ferredoxin oxidoreductase delta subunit|nr:4Fe-4S binding protein [Armatimonadota bacterium]
MAVRQIVQIDEERCDGCGVCVPACAEGAIQVIDGKARLVKDQYCDGLGACLGDCPQGAITLVEREAPEFDMEAVEAHLKRLGQSMEAHRARHPAPAPSGHGGGCPGAAARQFAARPAPTAESPSALQQWPIQLHLVSPLAPYFRNADVLLAADCAAFARGDFHARYLAGHALAIACPKLDDPSGYVEKLATLITEASIRSLTVVMMEVPCCRGLERLAEAAMELAGQRVPLRRVVIGIEGDLLYDDGALTAA